MAATSPSSSVKSAMRTLDLIEYVVARPDGAAAQELSTSLAIPMSSLSYLLSTLAERGYIERRGRRYVAGAGLDRLRGSPGEQSVVDRARPLIRALRVRLNETASLFVPVGWEMEAVVTEVAEQTLRYSIDVGTRAPLHCVSAGKAYLATLPEAAFEAYLLGSRREMMTPRTMVDADALRAEIAAVRARGHASTRDEYTVGISSIGAAAVLADGAVVAASVAVPSSRFSDEVEAEIVARVTETCRALDVPNGDLQEKAA